MIREQAERVRSIVQKRVQLASACICAMVCVILSGCGALELLEEIPAEYALYADEKVLESNGANAETEIKVLQLEELQEAPSFLMEEAQDYGFRSLTKSEQIWYRDIEQILGSFSESGDLSREGLEAGLDESGIDKIFQCVLLDHPELFYVEGYAYTKYTMGHELTAIKFSGTYSMDRATAETRKAEIETAAAKILAGVVPDSSQYEKVKYVYDTIISNTEYKLDAKDNQNIYSVFIHHLSVCQGYSKATQYLLNKLGIECTLVLGTVEQGEGHAWNLVKVDGSYYYVDTTWGDASYRMDNRTVEETGFATINYDYLNVTTRELLKTHSIGGTISMPECVSTEANYYVMEGLLVNSYDRLQLDALFKGRWREGYDSVTIKCASQECYDDVKEALIDKKEIFYYLQNRGDSVAFSTNEQQLSLTFWVTNE